MVRGRMVDRAALPALPPAQSRLHSRRQCSGELIDAAAFPAGVLFG
jgi:hypothetical protein